MKILVFSDVHGSLNCLNALKESFDFKSADKVIFLGDVVMGCSRPNECIEFIEQLGCDCVFGNNDSYIFDHVPSVDFEEFDEVKKEQLQYMARIVNDKSKNIMKEWRRGFFLNVGDKKIYFTHYAWENYNNDINVMDTPSDDDFECYENMFNDIDADYIIFGHDHKFKFLNNGKNVYCCVDSLGLKNPSSYLMINCMDGEIVLEKKYLIFDIEEEINLMNKAGYPYGKDKLTVNKCYTFDINNRAFKAIKEGRKKVEIRVTKVNGGFDYSVLKENDYIRFVSYDNEELFCEATKINWYKSIEKLLIKEGTKYTLSSTDDFEEGVKSINSFDGYKEGIKKNGVYAIHIKPVEF